MHPSHIRFLLVEDDPDHAELIVHTIRRLQPEAVIDHAHDGEEGMDFLLRRGRFLAAGRPDVVLLDVKMPRVDGLEVLAMIKTDPRLRLLPVVMLTTSQAESDRLRAYRNHANSYLVKPVDSEQFQTMLGSLSVYWSRWNQPPPGRAAA